MIKEKKKKKKNLENIGLVEKIVRIKDQWITG